MTLAELSNFSGELFWPGIAAWGYYHIWGRNKLHPQAAATVVTVSAIFLIPCYVIAFIVNVSDSSLGGFRWITAGLDMFMIGLVIYEVWQAWRRWRDKRKAFEALGAKSKALRDKLVKNLRDTTQPSPSRS